VNTQRGRLAYARQQNPIKLAEKWLESAKGLSINYNAMTVSTVNTQGAPSSRVVLIKDIQSTGFVFFTNYNSFKGLQISGNPNIAGNIYWEPLKKQISIEGIVKKTTRDYSIKYWQKRDRESQISQYISRQSEEVKDRATLENLYQEAEQEFANQEIPCPAHWGGYIIEPTHFIFWLERPHRLHDRFSYQKVENSWKFKRLFP